MMRIYGVLSAFLIALILCSPARAKDFYVATAPAGGSDSNPGTQSLPFLTIQHADNAAVVGFGAGSTVHVAPGNYLGSLGSLTKTGAVGSPITYLCDVKWSCFIKPTTSETNNWGVFAGGSGASYSTISGIATNSANCSGATPCVQITVSSPPPYTLTNGQIIQVSGAPVNTAANGQWAITVVSSTIYTLNGSAFINTCVSSCGTFRQGGTGAFTIFDGFDIDGTYPGTGQLWYTGIALDGFSSIIRNNRVHDIAYTPGANNGSSGGTCINDGGGYYGQSQTQIYNNLVFHCGPKGQPQSRIHGIYGAGPNTKVFNNIVWGVSGVCIESWHQATNQTFVNNTLADCNLGFEFAAGDIDWPRQVAATTITNGSNILVVSTTAGVVVGAGVHDFSNTACINNPELYPNVGIWVTSVDSGTQVHLSANTGSGCTNGDTIYFGSVNTGSFGANNIILNTTGNGFRSSGAAYQNTFANNATYNAPYATSIPGGDIRGGDVAITPSCLYHYVANDGNNNDYHLVYGCPAIGAGTPTNAPTSDFDGYPVPTGKTVDIGAYDSQPNPHAQPDKFLNWMAGGYSPAYRKDTFASSTATMQGTNNIGAQSRISSLSGVGDLSVTGGIVAGWPSNGNCGQGCINAQSYQYNGDNFAPSPMPPIIVNGAAVFDQQLAAAGTAYALANTTLTNVMDGWVAKYNNSNISGVSVQQLTSGAPTGFSYYIRMLIGTGSATVVASNYFYLAQPIEIGNMEWLGFGTAGAKPVCLSWYARSNQAGAVFGGSLSNDWGNSHRQYPFTFAVDGATNTWNRYFVCAPGDTVNNVWTGAQNAATLAIKFVMGPGTTFQVATPVAYAGSVSLPGVGLPTIVPGTQAAWQDPGGAVPAYGGTTSNLTMVQTVSGAYLDITGVQLEQSMVPTGYRHLTLAAETLQVERYAWRLAEPAAGVPTGGFAALDSTTTALGSIPLPATMRAAPTCTLSTVGTGPAQQTFHVAPAGAAASGTMAVGATHTTDTASVTFSGVTSSTAGFSSRIIGGANGGSMYCQARL